MLYKECLEILESQLANKIPKPLSKIAAQKVMASLYNQHLNLRQKNDEILILENNEYYWDLKNGKIKLSRSIIAKSIIEFFVYSLQIIFQFLSSNIQQKKEDYCLLYGIEKEWYEYPVKNMEFSRYLNKLSVQLEVPRYWLIDNTHIFRNRKLSNRIIATPCPVLSVILLTKGPLARLKLFVYWVISMILLLSKIIFSIEYLIVLRELIKEYPFINELNNCPFAKNVFTTTSSIMAQPLIFHKPLESTRKTSMIWYSSSSHNQYVEHGAYIDFSLYCCIQCDLHLVWTLDHAKFLEKSCNARAVVVGPQLFYLPTTNITLKTRTIAIFDLTPTNWKVFENTPYGEERSLRFLKDVFQVIDSLNKNSINPYRVQLKPKRKFTNQHSKRYINEVMGLSNRGIQVISSDINLFDYLSTVDIVVTNSLTSIGDLAEYLGVKVVYYDIPAFYKPLRIGDRFTQNIEQLKTWLDKNIV